MIIINNLFHGVVVKMICVCSLGTTVGVRIRCMLDSFRVFSWFFFVLNLVQHSTFPTLESIMMTEI